MASYELWVNGQQMSEIWANGEEYVEAWAVVDGVPTKVWAKSDGGEGGFYNASGELILSWNDTYYVMNNPTDKIEFNIPNCQDISTPLSLCTYFSSTINLLSGERYYKPIDFGDVEKIVVSSSVTRWTNQGIDGYSTSKENRNVREILFLDGENPLIIDGIDVFVQRFPKLEKLTMPSNLSKLEISNGVVANSGTEVTDGAIIDFSKCKLTELPSNTFYETRIKELKLPESLTSIDEYLLDHVNVNTDIYIEEINMPNVHNYPLFGFYYKINRFVIPDNSTVDIQMDSSAYIKHIIIGDNCTLEGNCIRLENVEKVDFNANSVTFNKSFNLYSYSSCNAVVNFSDSIGEIKSGGGASSRVIYCSNAVSGFYIHLPSAITSISSGLFYINSSEGGFEVMTIPSVCNNIEANSMWMSSSLGVRFENPNGWYAVTEDGTRIDMEGLDDPFVAGRRINTFYSLEWFRE